MKMYKLLEDRRSWTTAALARDRTGNQIKPRSEYATCWCIGGAISRCYDGTKEKMEIYHQIVEYVKGSPYAWNDHPDRTHEEVIAMLKELNL